MQRLIDDHAAGHVQESARRSSRPRAVPRNGRSSVDRPGEKGSRSGRRVRRTSRRRLPKSLPLLPVPDRTGSSQRDAVQANERSGQLDALSQLAVGDRRADEPQAGQVGYLSRWNMRMSVRIHSSSRRLGQSIAETLPGRCASDSVSQAGSSRESRKDSKALSVKVQGVIGTVVIVRRFGMSWLDDRRGSNEWHRSSPATAD